MVLNWWWMILIAAAIIGIALGCGIILARRSSQADVRNPAFLARAERIRSLPSFSKAVTRQQRVLVSTLVIGCAAILLGGVVAARPMNAETLRQETSSRDIMLCLDVSGSMTDVNREVLDVFLDLVKDFKGERIGLTIFNSSPAQVFPLTDDYAFVEDKLRILSDYLYGPFTSDADFLLGTLNAPGASLIGDGLAACAMRFDYPEQERSRSIIFASDNEVSGAQIVQVPEAAAYAASLNVRIFAINPVDPNGAQRAQVIELQEAAEKTDGKLYELRGATTVTDIINEVQKQEKRALQGEIEVLWVDSPDTLIVIFLVLAFGYIVVVWRLQS